MVEKLNSFYRLIKAETPIKFKSKLKRTFDSVNKALADAFELALKQPIPGKQLVLMTDASSRCAGFALIIEDNKDQNLQSKQKTYGLVVFGSEIFPPAQLKMSIYSEKSLAIYMAFPSLHKFCGNQADQQFPSQTTSATQSYIFSTCFAECMWLCLATIFQNSKHCRVSQHSSWLSLLTRLRS